MAKTPRSDFTTWLAEQFGPRPTHDRQKLLERKRAAAYDLARATNLLAKLDEYDEIERVARYAWNAALRPAPDRKEG